MSFVVQIIKMLKSMDFDGEFHGQGFTSVLLWFLWRIRWCFL